MRKIILFVAIAVTALILAKIIYPKHDSRDVQFATVSEGSFEIRVNTIGVLDAERSYIVSSEVKGDKGKIIYIIEDGTMVKKGDVLIKLDPSPFEAETIRLSGEMKSREAVVESAVQLLEWEKSQAEGTIHNTEFNFKDADQEYSRYISYLKDLEELQKKGFNYPTEIVQAKKKAEQLHAKLEKTETDLEQAKKDAGFKIANATAMLNKAKSELQTTIIALEDAKSEMKKTVIPAPFSGIIVHYELFRDNQKRKPRVGDTVWQNQPLLYLPDISSMIVKTQVREIDLHRISKEQKAAIRVDAYPEVLFEGIVTSIGVLATDGIEGEKGEKYFQLSVAVKSEDKRLRPGMTARVYLLTDSVKNALIIPLQSVFDESGKKYCYVYNANNLKKTEVLPGRQNDDFIEILAGLKKGEKVSLVKPLPEEIK